MPASAPRKCLCCNELLIPDYRHRRDQKYCAKPACKKASRAASRRAWLAKPEQKDWWHGKWNVERVREWRAQHPGYWRRKIRAGGVALQDTMKDAQPVDSSGDLASKRSRHEPCVTRYVPEMLKTQSPVVVGLIAQMCDDALQETIEATARRLYEKGRAVMGL